MSMIAHATLRELEHKSVSAVTFVKALFDDACILHASDVHIDPKERCVVVRFRIDGVLHHVCSFQSVLHDSVISRIKILTRLRTDEHSTPQDGRCKHVSEYGEYDIRVSCIPTQYGESIVLRLLSREQKNHTLMGLGFSPKDCDIITDALKTRWGMIIVTGPTGSGKTTTLYTLLHAINTPDISIITIEDPVEYVIDGVKHIQTQPRVGLSFAHGLRSMLRQDPDVIMVGEIRDTETARIAVNTALTGHLLLSTLHTINAATAIPRFIDMGIEPFLVTSTLRVVIAQRLVRTICTLCKKETTLSYTEHEMCMKLCGVVPSHVWHGVGCDACAYTGYTGRSVVAEVLVIDHDIHEQILERKSSSEIHTYAVTHGMTPILLDGIQKVSDGITTFEEVLRCLYE